MIRVVSCIILLHIAFLPCVFASTHTTLDNQYPAGIAEGSKPIPVVAFTTDGFINHVGDSFRFRNDREYYFYNEGNGSAEISYYCPEFIRNGNKFAVDVDLKLSNLQRNIIALKDSVFIFSPIERKNIPPHFIEYIGYIYKGRAYVVREADILPLKAFMSDGNSERYITRIKNHSYYASRSSYSLPTEKEAAGILRNNYFFTLIDGKDNSLAYNQLMQCLSGWIECNNEQRHCIQAIIDAASRQTNKLKFNFQANSNFNIADEIGSRETEYNNLFSKEERNLIDKALTEEYNRLQNAKRCFLLNISNIDENGVFRTDDDVFNIISVEVRKYR